MVDSLRSDGFSSSCVCALSCVHLKFDDGLVKFLVRLVRDRIKILCNFYKVINTNIKGLNEKSTCSLEF